jgi:hypothetical protein
LRNAARSSSLDFFSNINLSGDGLQRFVSVPLAAINNIGVEPNLLKVPLEHIHDSQTQNAARSLLKS